MKKINRILFSMLFLVAIAFIMVACEKDTTLADAKAELEITFAEGDNVNKVTKNLVNLPDKIGEVTVTWESSKSDVVNVNKTVTRQDEDVTVTLTATLTYKKDDTTKEFELTVVALEDTTLDDAKAALNLNDAFAEGDSANSVTKDLTLPNKVGDVVVTWKSSDDFVVENDGTVYQGTEDEDVTLTATLTYKGASVTKTFNITVLGLDVAGAKASLLAHYANTLANNQWIAEDIVLLTEIDHITLTWSSDKPAYFSNTGEVTKPAYVDGDQNIALTVTFEDGSQHIFRFRVEKLEQTTEEKIQERLDFVTILPSTPSEYQETNFEVVESVKIDGEDVDVVWTTSDEDVMSIKGVINPKGLEIFEDMPVTLTASITYKGITLTKSLDFLIKGMINGDSFADLVTAENANEKIFVKNVELYYNQGTNGYYLVTSDGSLAYINGISSMPAADKLFNVTATVDNFYNSLQLKDASFNEVGDKIGYDVPHEEITIEDIVLFPLPSSSNVYGHDAYKLKDVKVIVQGTGNYNTFLVDKDFDPETDKRTKENSVMFYYTSQINEIRELEGVAIKEIDLVLEGYRTDHNIWYFSYLKPMDEIELYDLTDAEIVEKDRGNLSLPSEVVKPGTIELLTEGTFGSTIVWSFTNSEDVNNQYINLTNGDVTMPAEEIGRVNVKLTATLTKGDETTTKDFVVPVGVHTLKTIADALALNKDLTIMVKGVVTGLFANNTYGFQDESGAAISVFTTEELTVGRTYIIVGTRDDYNGLPQLKNIEIEDISGGEMPDPVAINDMLNDNTALKAYIAARVSIDGAEVVEVGEPDKYGNIEIKIKKNDTTLTIRYDSRVPGGDKLDGITVGDTVNYVGHLGWFNGAQLGFGPQSYIGEGQPDKEVYELIVTYDFTNLNEGTGTLVSDGKKLIEIFDSVATDEGRILSATDLDRIYAGNGTGGGEFENNPGVIKTGTGSATAKMTLGFDKKVHVVVLTLRGWTATDKVTINDQTLTAPAATGELLFILNEPSYTLEFFIDKRILMTEMLVDFGSDEEYEGPVVPVYDEVSIAKFLEEDEGMYIITGLITSLAPHTSFSMEDETGAVAFRIGGKNSANIDFKVGDVVKALVKKNVFGGLVQAQVAGDYEVVDKVINPLPILDLDVNVPTAAYLLANQARIVKAKDAKVVSVEADDFGTPVVVVKIGDEEVTIKYDNRIPGFNSAFLLGLKKDDLVDIDGATISVASNNPLLMIDDVNQVTNENAEDAILEYEFNQEVDGFKFDKLTLTEDTTLDLVVEFGDDIDVLWSVVEGAEHIDLLTGKVTIPDETATLILKAEFLRGDFTTERTYEFTLSVPVEGQVFHETFDTSNLTGTYADSTFTGVNNVEWVVTHSRDEGDDAIDGKGVMLRRGSDSSISVTFADGISWFSFDAKKAFTGATIRTLVVTINGVDKEVVVNSGSGQDDTVFNFDFDVVGEGPTTIVIKPKVAGNHQTTIDNFKWIE